MDLATLRYFFPIFSAKPFFYFFLFFYPSAVTLHSCLWSHCLNGNKILLFSFLTSVHESFSFPHFPYLLKLLIFSSRILVFRVCSTNTCSLSFHRFTRWYQVFFCDKSSTYYVKRCIFELWMAFDHKPIRIILTWIFILDGH